jgi:hypothetical protein
MIEYLLLAQMVGSMEHSLSPPQPGMLPTAPTYSWEPSSSEGFRNGWSSTPPSGGSSGSGGSVRGTNIFHEDDVL